MKASDFLFEVFDSDVPGKIIRASNESFITKATIGSREIKFTGAGNDGNWEVDFTEHSPDRGSTFRKSGSGNELQVFSFVLESLKLLIAKYSPDSVLFTSDESDGNRTSLYARMSRKITIPGYEMQIEHRPGNYTVFRIVRKTTDSKG